MFRHTVVCSIAITFFGEIRVDTPILLLAEMRQSGNRSFMQGS